MILPSYDGSEVEINIAGNRWPNLEGGHQTRYWLKVSLRALAPFGSIHILNIPCLLDWEAEKLIQWLEAIVHGDPVPRIINFFDGSFGFEILSSQDHDVALRCHVLSDATHWTLRDGIDRKDFLREHAWDQEIDLTLSRNRLARSVSELRHEFAQLPVIGTAR